MVNYSIKLKKGFIKFLRSTERYTKTDMVYLAREGFWSLFGQIIGIVSSAAVTILLANILSKESFGQYRFVLSIIPILAIFVLPGINTAVMRSVARGDRVNLSKMVKTEIRWGFFGSIIAIGIAGYYFFKGDSTLFLALILTAVFLPFLEPFSISSAYYKGKQNFKIATIYESVSRFFQAVVLIIVAFFTKSILAIIGAFFISQIVARLFFYIKTLRDEKLKIFKEENIIEDQSNETIKYGKILTATQTVDTITGNIDKLIVGYLLGAEILAIYYVALTIPNNLILMFNTMSRIAFPKFSKNTWNPDERIRFMYKLLIFFGALTILTIFYFLLTPFIIPVIFRNYGVSIPVALMLSPIIFLSPLNAMIGQALQARKLVKNIFFLQIAALITFIAVFLIMYKNIGANPIDVVIALIVSEAISLCAGIWFARK